MRDQRDIWADAMLAAALFAVDPPGLGGVSLRAHPGPVRDMWVEELRRLLSGGALLRRVPLHIADDRLLGGIDLAATLTHGRPVVQRGVLSQVDGGVLVLAMAERIEPSTAARISAVMDRGCVDLERDGLTLSTPSRFGVLALDEGLSVEEAPPPGLLDRLAFRVDLDSVGVRQSLLSAYTPDEIIAARKVLQSHVADDDLPRVMCEAAEALGITSLRAPLLAVRVARVMAALQGCDRVEPEHAAAAGRLVLGPRASQIPRGAEDEDQQPPPPSDDLEEDVAPSAPPAPEHPGSESGGPPPLEEVVLAAARAVLDPGLIALMNASQDSARARFAGRTSSLMRSSAGGRPAGVRTGVLGRGARLNVLATLRAAAPWQPVRRAENARVGKASRSGRVDVRREDFRITRYKQRTRTTTVFVVDASGSAALHRLAEAKGAVELLLADSYVRRDQVALIAFRGSGAEVLLSPTRSLARARRSLAGLPGGGGTPLASGIDCAAGLAEAVRARGEMPALVFLTDGRANISRDGAPGRAQAEADAIESARRMRSLGLPGLVVDTSPQPQQTCRKLAQEMGARYLALPYADSARLSEAIRATGGGAMPGMGRG